MIKKMSVFKLRLAMPLKSCKAVLFSNCAVSRSSIRTSSLPITGWDAEAGWLSSIVKEPTSSLEMTTKIFSNWRGENWLTLSNTPKLVSHEALVSITFLVQVRCSVTVRAEFRLAARLGELSLMEKLLGKRQYRPLFPARRQQCSRSRCLRTPSVAS